MKQVIHKLPMRKFLRDIKFFEREGLPTNSFIYKKVPGCGATTLELLFPRNSIILEPNIPVIIGKCDAMNRDAQGHKLRKYKNVLGVYEGISVDDIRFYLKNKKGYKKILSTPEGFSKILEAIGDSIYTDYFLLFDECEKAIQDVDFRKSIINPIDAFFLFDKKAFVSATPIYPSDERFNDFTIHIVEPQYDFKENIKVTITNNVIFNLKKLIDHYDNSERDKDRKIFVFLKSTNRIKNIINGLNIGDRSSVYCSEDSMKKLKLNNIENVYSSVNDKFTRFNFLTSRFFSAVDINYKMYKCNPIIIMMTDVIAVEHSVIDPFTEAPQICGRFRKPNIEQGEADVKVLKNIYHISNYNSKLDGFSKEQVFAVLKDKKEMYDFICKFRPTSQTEYINKFIDEVKAKNGFEYFLTDGSVNPWMVDNFINIQKVKSYYKFQNSLIEAYMNSEHFNVDKSSKFYYFNIDDEILKSISDTSSTITVNDMVSELVRKALNNPDENGINFQFEALAIIYPKQIDMIKSIGMDHAKILDFDINKIISFKIESKKFSALIPIIKYMHKNFVKGKFYSAAKIKEILDKGISETKSFHCKPTIPLLKNAFNISPRVNIKEKKLSINGYNILEKLQIEKGFSN